MRAPRDVLEIRPAQNWSCCTAVVPRLSQDAEMQLRYIIHVEKSILRMAERKRECL